MRACDRSYCGVIFKEFMSRHGCCFVRCALPRPRLVLPPHPDTQCWCSVWGPILVGAPTTINMMIDLCSADGLAPRWWSGCATPPPEPGTPVPRTQYTTYPPDKLPTASPFLTQSPLTTVAPWANAPARSGADASACDPLVCAMGTDRLPFAVMFVRAVTLDGFTRRLCSRLPPDLPRAQLRVK
jgi:hypothetical protein